MLARDGAEAGDVAVYAQAEDRQGATSIYAIPMMASATDPITMKANVAYMGEGEQAVCYAEVAEAVDPRYVNTSAGETAAASTSPSINVKPIATTTAPAACSYCSTRDGRQCRQQAAPGFLQCKGHTCTMWGCSNPKSTQVDFCDDHSESFT